MPRRKPAGPQRLSEEEQRAQRWNLGQEGDDDAGDDEPQVPEPSGGWAHALLNVPDESGSESDDEDYVQPSVDDDVVEIEAEPSVNNAKKRRIKTRDDVDWILKYAGEFLSEKVSKKSPNPDEVLVFRFQGKDINAESAAENLDLMAMFEASQFCLRVKCEVPESSGWTVPIGSYSFVTEDFQVPSTDFNIVVSEVPDMSFLSTTTDGCKNLVKIKDIPKVPLLRGFCEPKKKHSVALVLDEEKSKETGNLILNVVLAESNMCQLNHPSDVAAKVSFNIKLILNFLSSNNFKLPRVEALKGAYPPQDIKIDEFDDDDVNLNRMLKVKADDLFKRVTRHHSGFIDSIKNCGINPQHSSLLPTLRPYQKNAVLWMMQQEQKCEKCPEIHVLYEEVVFDDGRKVYFNRSGGFFVEKIPKGLPTPPGGILADEMGLGKTVEILSLMLCHPRPNMPTIEWKEPILINQKESRKRRRRRSPSPTEFQIEPKLNEIFEDHEKVMQVDGAGDTSPSSSESSEEEYVPDRKAVGRRASRAAVKRVVFAESGSDTDEDCWKPPAKKVKPKKSVLKKPVEVLEKFDPGSVLEGRVVNSKSKISDMILSSIVSLGHNSAKVDDGISVNAIKNFIFKTYGKKHTNQTNKIINKELLGLVERGLICNTSGLKGASGSFRINPKFKEFDSRGLYVGKDLDEMDKTIEEVIGRVCYDNEEYVAPEITPIKAKKKVSLYEKLKPLYEKQMADMSEVCELTDRYKKARRKWNGTFFDTKVERTDYFECVCGEDDWGNDPKYRVQCGECGQHQHAECVGYDVSDPYRGDYYCPHCWSTFDPTPSKATLIVSPSSIAYQWIDEMKRHLSADVKVLFYRGTKLSGYIQPRQLAKYDIVVTTYTVLQSETNYVDLPHNNSTEGRRFRNPKRWMAVPAPLPCVNWWRLCLDEAQMIETTTTKTAEMARRLSAVNRWCVTGTPIRDSINDFFGLLVFLGIDPYNVDHWWRSLLCVPYIKGQTSRLETVLSKFLWRTAKKDVIHQIDIPEQTEEIHWLRFSPIEEHFYRRQHIECTQDVQRKINRFNLQENMQMSDMDRKTLSLILQPIIKLRQACCHPQIVKGVFMNMQKSTLTMEQLLENMIKKITLECEDANRQYIASLNGIAGLDVIEEKWNEAAETYREVLRWVGEYKDKLKTDSLQKLHTVTNLAEILESHSDISPTLRDSELRNEAKKLQEKYLTKYTAAIAAANDAVSQSTKVVEELRDGFVAKDTWYETVIDSVSKSGTKEDNLMKMVLEEMSQFYDVVNDREFRQIESKYPSSRTVLVKVAEKVTVFDTMRDAVFNDLHRMRTSPSERYLNQAVDCHLRASSLANKKRRLCELCSLHDIIEEFEGQLFHFVKKGEISIKNQRETLTVEEEEILKKTGVLLHSEQRKGTWAESEPERLLRAILKYAKSNSMGDLVIDDGQRHLKLIEAMKKEFKVMRILWRQIYDHVAAVDELNMSTLRLRLRYDDEPVPTQSSMKRVNKNDKEDEGDDKPKGHNLGSWNADKFETIYILEKHEIPSQRLKLVSEKTVAINEFKKKHGQLLYLEQLKRSGVGKSGGGDNPEPCPICTKPLGSEWSVLQCGHCFCVECIRTLIDEYTVKKSVRCAICRNLTFHGEISYVKTKKVEDKEEEFNQEIKGSLSTKVEAVVKSILKIQSLDSTAKCLVFSTWNGILDIIGEALAENDVHFASLSGSGKEFKRNLQKFKNREDVKILLMPLKSGANGLNLVEANHVLLVEPILNPSHELQAIGRVHRIGQKRNTTVHRFIVRDTMEERVHHMFQNGSASAPVSEEELMEASTHCASNDDDMKLLTVENLKSLFSSVQNQEVRPQNSITAM